jgi:D-alanyl-D-alanine carboxypeptidase
MVAVVATLLRVAGRTATLVQIAQALPTPRSDRPAATAPVAVVLGPTATPAPNGAAAATLVPSATIVPTPTIIPGCELYNASDDLLIRVDHDTALQREYEPDDLAAVPLNPKNAWFGALLLRRVVHQPLLALLEAMNQPELELQVIVVSGYRSYTEQSEAYEKWQERYPDRVSNISAVPGHSEHQTGTAVAPYMEDLFGEQFHPQFFYTKEGQWLANNAAKYGFVMSYPSWAVDQTGYEWEPWHFRYVGVELAADLTDRSTTVSEFIRTCSAAG